MLLWRVVWYPMLDNFILRPLFLLIVKYNVFRYKYHICCLHFQNRYVIIKLIMKHIVFSIIFLLYIIYHAILHKSSIIIVPFIVSLI